MSASLRVGQTLTLTAAADDPSGALDPNAVDTWEEDSGGAIIALTGNGSTATINAVAAGTARVAAKATDPDGNEVSSDPFDVTVLAATDAATVTITASAPAGASQAPAATPPQATPQSPTAQQPLYTFSGSGTPSAEWTDSGLRTGDGQVLYTFSGDAAGGAPTGASAEWSVFTGTTVPASA